MLSLVNIPCPRRDSQRIEIINRNKQAPQISQLIVTSLPGAKRKLPSTLNSERTSLNRGVNKTTNCVQEEWNNLTVDIHLEANMYWWNGCSDFCPCSDNSHYQMFKTQEHPQWSCDGESSYVLSESDPTFESSLARTLHPEVLAVLGTHGFSTHQELLCELGAESAALWAWSIGIHWHTCCDMYTLGTFISHQRGTINRRRHGRKILASIAE